MTTRAVAPLNAQRDPSALSLALPDVQPLTVGVAESRIGGIRGSIASLAREMADPAWGAQGTIKGMETEIAVSRLWISPLSAIDYPDEEVQALAQSIRETGRVEKPLIVTLHVDPRDIEEGGVGGDHLVIDGEMTLKAMDYVALEFLPVVYRSYPSLWHATRASVAAKTTAHEIQEHEVGRLIWSLVAAHEATRARRPDIKLGKLTQEEIGRIVGRSQSSVSRWMDLATAEGALADYLASGDITTVAAFELMVLPPAQQREAVVALVEKKRVTGKPATQRDARETAQRHRSPSAPRYAKSLSDTPTRPPSGLWIPALVNHPSPVAIGALIHDLTLWLEQTKATRGNLDRDAQRLLDALKTEALQEHALQVKDNF